MDIDDRLTRRVKRHSQFGVLFRMPEEDAFEAVTPGFGLPVASPLQPGELQENLPVIADMPEMDTLLELQEPDVSFPVEPKIEPERKLILPPKLTPETPKFTSPLKAAPLQRTPVPRPSQGRQLKADIPAQPPGPSRTTAGQNIQLPTIPPNLPAGDIKEEEATISDADWRRLQTIMRKHQEKTEEEQARSGETIDQPGASTREVLQQQPGVDQPKTAQAQVQGSLQAREMKGSQPLPVREDVQVISEGELESRNQPNVGSGINEKPVQRPFPASKIQEIDPATKRPMQTKSYDQAVQPAALSTPIPAPNQLAAPEPVIDTVKPLPVEPRIAHAVQASSESNETGLKNLDSAPQQDQYQDQSTSEIAKIPAIQRQNNEYHAESVLGQGEREQDFADESRINPVSLDQVWPIQKNGAVSENQTLQATTSFISPNEPLPLVEAGHGEDVRQLLSSVKPAQVTDTSVEVITPRRVRPPIQTVQRAPKADQPPLPPRRESRAENAVPARPAQQPGMVPTEIGPLPADLWELMGQTPPLVQKLAAEPEQPVSMQRQVELVEDKKEDQSASSLMPEEKQAADIAIEHPLRDIVQKKRIDQPGQTGVVQESPEDESASPQAGDSAVRGEAAATGQSDQENEQKVEELARKVYSEIKRRLAIEWERARKIF